MKIRTALVLACFLLSVVPLGAIVVYSCFSSRRALQSAYWAEATKLTAQMDKRLSTIRGLLDPLTERRILFHLCGEKALDVRDALDVAAEHDHVVAGKQRALGDRLVRAVIGYGVHLHVVGDRQTVESGNFAKQLGGDPLA